MITELVETAIVAWLLVLSYFIVKIGRRYIKLLHYSNKKGELGEIIDRLLKQDEILVRKSSLLEKEVDKLKEKERKNFKKIGILRYSAFKKGLKDSVILSLLDEEDNGVVLNFIHTHDGIRVFTKQLKKGKGVTFELSSEEMRAVKEAR